METLIINGMRFDFYKNEAGVYEAIESSDCEDELLSFIEKDWPKSMNKRPQVVKYIEEMIKVFYGKK